MLNNTINFLKILIHQIFLKINSSKMLQDNHIFGNIAAKLDFQLRK